MRATQRITEAIATMRMFKSKYDKKATPRTPLKALRYDFTLAIQALEKQVAKKPVDKIMFEECPNCGSVEIANCRYCCECGQKIDWSDEE